MTSAIHQGIDDRLRSLLHPYEASRFMAAAVVAAVLAAFVAIVLLNAGVTVTIMALVLLALWLAFFKFIAMVHRARLLSGAVRVTPTCLPELDAIVKQTKAWLELRDTVDIYVAPDVDGMVTAFHLFGVRVVMIDSDLLADLLAEEELPRLRFLIASRLGALKARHLRLAVVSLMLGESKAAAVFNPFLLAYRRAATYSGDQIGLAYCGDLESALGMIAHMMAGRRIAADLKPGQILGQAALARQSLLARFAQLSSTHPHLFNRYANLTSFAGVAMPEMSQAFRSGCDPETLRLADEALRSSPYAGRRMGTSDIPVQRVEIEHERSPERARSAVRARPPQPPLSDYLPAELSSSGAWTKDDPALQSVARLDWRAIAPGVPSTLVIRQFDHRSRLATACERLVAAAGAASSTEHKYGAWPSEDQVHGHFFAAADPAVLVWSYEQLGLVAVATDPHMSVETMAAWWEQTRGTIFLRERGASIPT